MTRRCPVCRQQTSWDDNPWRPFCSERCQTIDLGRWASEEYRVPLEEPTESLPVNVDRESNTNEQS